MTHPDFGPVDERERAELDALADRLLAARPLPSPMFRGELRRRLVVPRRSRRTLRWRAAASLATGLALLLVATLGAIDVGPLAPTTSPADAATVVVSASS